jgi:predicted transcriptional regulator
MKSGLLARTKILLLLDTNALNAKKISQDSQLHYNVVLYHLRLLKCEGTIERRGDKRYIWLPSGIGQKRLD